MWIQKVRLEINNREGMKHMYPLEKFDSDARMALFELGNELTTRQF